MTLCSADFATPIQLYAGQATLLSKSRPTNAPPDDISGTNASASALREYVETCSATDTSSHCAAMKSSPRHDLGRESDGVQHAVDAPPLPGQLVAHLREVLRHRDVELEHLDVPGQLAGGALGQAEAAAGAGQHELGTLPLRQLGHRVGDRGVRQARR